MAAVRSLLNPIESSRDEDAMPSTPRRASVHSDNGSPRKKAKLTKDAAVFTPGPIRGKCRFPPDEYQDEFLKAEHDRFKVTPFGDIASFPRHIPYNSDKKKFVEKTQREYLEVFQYTFQIPNEDHVYTVLWDYNIGLVRTTPLFKCTGHSKTTPAKMLARNAGLKQISHSITGGALVAQGYWIPHEAAKAIAATFCYKIRYALTPVFGKDFPELCLKPDDDSFGNMIIDPEITAYCARQAESFRDELQSKPSPTPHQWSVATETPSRTHVSHDRRAKRVAPAYSSPYDSPYASDTGSDDGYTTATSGTSTTAQTPMTTPAQSHRHSFTPINKPRLVPRSVPYPERRLPSPRDILQQSEQFAAQSAHGTIFPMTPPRTGRVSSPEISPKTIPAELRTSGQAFRVGEYQNLGRSDLEWLEKKIRPEEERAAYILLGLKFGGRSPAEVARGLGISYVDGEQRFFSA